MAGRKQQLKPALNGAIGGLATNLGARFLGGSIGPGVGTAASGFFLKDDWLMEMGGFQLGATISAGIPMVGAGGGASFL